MCETGHAALLNRSFYGEGRKDCMISFFLSHIKKVLVNKTVKGRTRKYTNVQKAFSLYCFLMS